MVWYGMVWYSISHIVCVSMYVCMYAWIEGACMRCAQYSIVEYSSVLHSVVRRKTSKFTHSILLKANRQAS